MQVNKNGPQVIELIMTAKRALVSPEEGFQQYAPTYSGGYSAATRDGSVLVVKTPVAWVTWPRKAPCSGSFFVLDLLDNGVVYYFSGNTFSIIKVVEMK